jgi:hypothetical protein
VQELCELLTGLLRQDSAARLTLPQVQAAAWFEGFDWAGLQSQTLAPPVHAHPASSPHARAVLPGVV